MKIPRFMKEYANFKLKSIKENDLMREDLKIKAINKVNKTLRTYEMGAITVDEAIINITYCFE